MTLRAFIEDSLRAALASAEDAELFSLRDARVRGNGMRPEFRGASWETIRDAIYGERL